MAVIKTLGIAVKAKTGDFTKGLKKARRSLRRFTRNVPLANMSVTKFGMAASAAALGGIAVLTKRSMRSIDVTAKLADRLNMTTEAIAAYGMAAQITGTDQASFNKSIEIMNRRLGEAQMGLGEARYALDEMGISLDDILKLKPSEQFKALADGIKGLVSPSKQAAAANQLFGRAGMKMINMLKLGSEGLEKFERDAKKLGITLSKGEAANVEKANDALTKLGLIFEGIGNTLAVKFSPWITRVANQLEKFGTASDGMASKVGKAFDWILKKLAGTADYLLLAKSLWKGLEGAGVGAMWAILKPLGKLNTQIMNLPLTMEKAFDDVMVLVGKAGREMGKLLVASPEWNISAIGEQIVEASAGIVGRANKRMFERGDKAPVKSTLENMADSMGTQAADLMRESSRALLQFDEGFYSKKALKIIGQVKADSLAIASAAEKTRDATEATTAAQINGKRKSWAGSAQAFDIQNISIRGLIRQDEDSDKERNTLLKQIVKNTTQGEASGMAIVGA